MPYHDNIVAPQQKSPILSLQTDSQNHGGDAMKNQFITMYLPIFREKLERLERQGQGSTPEAERLRRTLAQVEDSVPQTADEELDTAA
jgi:hypothetical protein